MADLIYALLAFLALGVGTLLWAIHEINRDPLDDDPPKPTEDA